MNLLTGLFILLCLMAFVNGEGHRSGRQKFKLYKQRRHNLGQRNQNIEPVTTEFLSPPPSPSPSPTPSSSTPSTSPTTSPTYGRSYHNKDHFEYEKLVNRFDQED